MKKSYLLAAMALMLVSCSQDETIDVNRENDVIQFGVVTDAAGRAADIYCNNNKPSQFTVYANSNGSTYIDGDVIKYQNEKWENTSGVRYWPTTAVDFYAHVNGTGFTWKSGEVPTIVDYTVDTDVTKQNDLLYAVKAGETSGEVTLNFRHALSQIVFRAQNKNANLYVEISGVKICNLGNKNTFTYPSNDTDNNIEDTDHDGTFDYTIDYSDGSWGTWGTISGSVDYEVTFETVKVSGDSNVYSLTSANDKKSEFSSKAMILLPQTTEAWAPTATGNGNANAESQSGTYFLVDCKIYNVAGDSYTDGDVNLWDGEVAIPVAFNWEQGKKYIYTFVFGDGNGGYDPDPDPSDPDPDPKPVLVPITFNVTVDDFVTVENQDINMETNTTNP